MHKTHRNPNLSSNYQLLPITLSRRYSVFSNIFAEDFFLICQFACRVCRAVGWARSEHADLAQLFSQSLHSPALCPRPQPCPVPSIYHIKYQVIFHVLKFASYELLCHQPLPLYCIALVNGRFLRIKNILMRV